MHTVHKFHAQKYYEKYGYLIDSKNGKYVLYLAIALFSWNIEERLTLINNLL